ncbi:hypothetical protein Dimus_031891 [Dionaea muscipula]
MGEWGAYLIHSYALPSQSSPHFNEENLLHAHGESISLGRYISESLDWGKWSAFSQNRYVEEAEKCSRPGFVAKMKAHFEAHFKRTAATKRAMVIDEPHEEANGVSEVEASDTVGTSSSCLGSAEPTKETSHENKSLSVVKCLPLPISSTDQKQSGMKSRHRSADTWIRRSTPNRAPSALSTVPRDIAITSAENSASDSLSKRLRTFKSIHTTTNKGTSPAVPAEAGTRNAITSSVKIKRDGSTPRETPSRVSSSRMGTSRNRPFATQHSQARIRNSEDATSYRLRIRSSTAFSPFSFKCEERAAKRAEFAQKQQQREAEKMQLPLKEKQKLESNPGKLQQSINLKANTQPSSINIKLTCTTRPRLLEVQKPTSEDSCSQFPQHIVQKTDRLRQGWRNKMVLPTTTCMATSRVAKKISERNENNSPNIIPLCPRKKA